MAPALGNLVEVLPERVVSDALRGRLESLGKQLDQLLFIDRFDELAVDRASLIRLANNKDLVPVELRDVLLVETSKHVGRRVREFKEKDGDRRISWQDGPKYGIEGRPMSADEVRSLGITEDTPDSEVAGIVRTLVPEIPPFWMNDDSTALGESVIRQFASNRTVWDCVVANLGWWAAITLGGGLVIFVILVVSGVPWPWALLAAGIYQTGATLYFLLQCVANPAFQQR